MAWSHAIRLRDFGSFREGLQKKGIYEIGFARNNIFNPLYIGKATIIYDRLKAHYTGKGNKDIWDYLVKMERDNLWCHWMGVSDPGYSEANLLNRFKIGKKELYKFNKRIEKKRARISIP